MKITLRCAFLILILHSQVSAQEIGRQMISSQGASITTASGLKVTQTIGQQSTIGSSTGSVIVQQGYQQSYWQSYIQKTTNTINNIKLYPNPASDILNFNFGDITNLPITILLYDVNGRLVYNQKLQVINSKLSIDVSKLNAGMYLVKLQGANLNYYSKILVN